MGISGRIGPLAAPRIGPQPAPGRPRSAKRGGGFTLIEVVVAFVLLSLVLATSFEIFTNGFRRAVELEDYSRATAVAQSRLAATGQEDALQEGETQGDTEDRRFHWVVTVKRSDEGTDPSRPATALFSLYRVDVTVTWQAANGKDRSLPLSTLVLGQRP